MTEGVIGTKAIEKIDMERFAGLLQIHNQKRPAYDQVLLETQGCVVTPTLGSIIPNWLLVVPRQPAVNFRHWQATNQSCPVWLVDKILGELNIDAQRTIWFEHGPSTQGSAIGCGVDYAHLHILVDAPFSFEQFAALAVDDRRIDWCRHTPETAYNSTSAETSYLVASSRTDAILAEDIDSIGSQFFRRVVAALVGKTDQWNYKKHAHAENVDKTIATFSGTRTSIILP